MKKAIDQTVRDLKREVNKKVLKVPGIEQKILDATSNEPWGPHGSLLADIAQASHNSYEYQIIMHVVWKRLNDTGKNWRHVYKALTVLEYVVGHGSERVIDDIREHAYQISTLSDFQYIDSSGRDQGSNVRRKSQSLVALVNDKERIQEFRQKALANKDKYRSPHASGGRSPYSSGGGYGDRYDDERDGSRSRDGYGNGNGRERDWSSRDDDRYGRGGPYNRDGDRYGRYSDEGYGRDHYRDDDYRGRGNDEYQFGQRSRSLDRDRDRFSEEEDRNSSQHSGARVDEPSQDERRGESKISEQSSPPSYEEAVKDTHDHVQDERSVNVAPSGTKADSPSAIKTSSPAKTSHDHNQSGTGVSVSASNRESDEFDEFDPRGSMPATPAPPAPASGSGVDLFGEQSASDPINLLALVPVSFTSEADTLVSSGVETNFVPLSSASAAFCQPSEDPFGDGPFKATAQQNFQAQQQGFAPDTSIQQSSGMVQDAVPPASSASKMETAPIIDFGGPLAGLTYTLTKDHQQLAANHPSIASEFPVSQANNSDYNAANPSGSAGLVPSQAYQQPAFPINMQTANINYVPQAGISSALAPQPAAYPQITPINYPTQPVCSSQTAQQITSALGQSTNSQPPKDKFETKSTIWADTLNRGLVNLNISGTKVNSLADIGVDFEAINRMDRRKEKSSAAPVTSTLNMGKAMGTGSGIGRAGAGTFISPSNPMVGSGMGMGMGAGMGMGMGMGSYGGGMNQPTAMGMGMNRAMNPGAQMHPPAQGPGVPGVGYNPMMGTGTGGYGSQQPYGGGYR